MPYQAGNRLPGERASKIGHIEVINSPLVQNLCKNFQDPDNNISERLNNNWQPLPTDGEERKIIFSSDGSIQIIEQKHPPYKAIAFIKTALLKMDQFAINKIDRSSPHPFAIRDLLKESALFHATAFPLRNVITPGKTTYNSIREILFESIKDKGYNDSLDGSMMETLKWIAYEKWLDKPKQQLDKFGCPYCDKRLLLFHLTKKLAHARIAKTRFLSPICLGFILL